MHAPVPSVRPLGTENFAIDHKKGASLRPSATLWIDGGPIDETGKD